MVTRLFIFTIFASLTALSAHLFFGGTIFAEADETSSVISLRDVYENKTHELSGIVMVPSTCHEISVRAKDADARTTVVIFETWEQSYRTGCKKTPTPRAIRVMAFAPKYIEFVGIFDNNWVPLNIVLEKK
jgi:hypothetical protein